MRTTIDVEDDILAAARELARIEKVGVGTVISRLVRQSLTSANTQSGATGDTETVAGFRPFPANAAVVTNEQVDQLRDEEGI